MLKVTLSLAILLAMTAPAVAYSCGKAKVAVDDPGYAFEVSMAGALYDPHTKTIHLSSNFMNSRSYALRQFVFAHECGHYYNGAGEMKADNFALRSLKRRGIKLSSDDINSMCNELGPQRCDNIKKNY